MMGEPCFGKHELPAEKIERLGEFSPFRYTLCIDWDYPWPDHWLPEWQRHINFMLEDRGLAVEKVIMKESPSREGGKHVWIHIVSARKLSDDEINMLQWLCLDHHTRTWINILRIQRGLKKFWNKLFSGHLWKKPLPKRCQKCKLREILQEMKEKYDERN
jgi:hypothetical protein